MLRNQTVNHVSEHLSAIYPVYTPTSGGGLNLGHCERPKGARHSALK